MRSAVHRTVLAAVVAGLSLTSVLPSYATHDNGKGAGRDGSARAAARADSAESCIDRAGAVRQMSLPVGGGSALALVALPRSTPRGIVVFDHGYGHTMESWRHHVARTARTLRVIAIAPNYRNQDIPPLGKRISSRGWWVAEGAEDTIAYAQHFDRLCAPTGINVVYGVSMGGNTSGLAVAAKPKARDGSPLFDYWVNVEGVSNVTETYLGAVTLSPASRTAREAREDIERAFGGTPADKPEVYAARTVVNRTADIAAAGLRGVVQVHGVADGLVSHDHSRQLQALLRARGVPVDMWSAVTRADRTEPGTTVDGYLPTGHESPFAGHASETSTTHVVGVAGFAALGRLYRGRPFTCGETVYDGRTRTTTHARSTGC